MTATISDLRFMAIADEGRSASNDPKAKAEPSSAVSALIVKSGSVISRGSNNFSPNTNESDLIFGDDRYLFIEHAERVALFKCAEAGIDTKGSTIYSTRHPCSDCARAIVYFGVSRIVTRRRDSHGKWARSQEVAEIILKRNNISITVIE